MEINITPRSFLPFAVKHAKELDSTVRYKGSFSVGLDLALSFHLYQTALVFSTYISRSRRNAACAGAALLLESQGKPTLGGSPEGKSLQSGEETTKNQTYRLFQLIASLCYAPLLARDPRFSTKAAGDLTILPQRGAEPLHGHAPSASALRPPNPKLLSQTMICSRAISMAMSHRRRTAQIKESRFRSLNSNQRCSALRRSWTPLESLQVARTSVGHCEASFFSPGVGSLIQHGECRTDLPPAESQPVPHAPSRSCV